MISSPRCSRMDSAHRISASAQTNHWFSPAARWSGSPGWFPTPGPHGSGHAELPHPALRIMDSLHTHVAIRWCFVHMLPSLDVLVMFPPNGSMIRHPLPSAGSSGASVPASSVLRDAPTPCHPSRRTSLPSFGGTTPVPLCLVSRSPSHAPIRPRHTTDGPGVFMPVAPEPALDVETTGSPRFLADPPVDMPCSATPVRSLFPGPLRDREMLPSVCETTSALTFQQFRGSIARPAHSLSTLRSHGLPHAHARLASGCWPALPDGIGYPLGPTYKVYALLHQQPPCPSFAWRTSKVFTLC